MCEIGLAVNRSWFDKQANQRRESTCFVDCTLWGRTAEVAGEYLEKGRQVLIEGRLEMDEWDDRETGKKRTKLKVVCEQMTMIGGKSEGGGSRRQSSKPEQPYEPGPDSPPDDEVPF